jgi:membrane protease YdiL (CAAX protease family)
MDSTPRESAFRWTLIPAWLAIVLTIGVVVQQTSFPLTKRQVEAGDQAARSTEHLAVLAQGRYLVGLKSLVPSSAKEAYEQLRTQQRGDFSDQLRWAILAGELVGPGEALEKLQEASEQRAPNAPEEARARGTRILKILDKLYRFRKDQPTQPLPLSDLEREQLRDALGWFGELALTPPDSEDVAARASVVWPARRVVIGTALLIGMAGVALMVGVMLLPLAVILALRSQLGTGLVPATPTAGAIYAETFALWLVVYLGLAFLARYLPHWEGNRLMVSAGAMVLSFGVLAWPLLRGLSWRQVRDQLGLHTGRGVGVEIGSGIAGYLAGLPLVLLGLFAMLTIQFIQKQFGFESPPSHPINEEVLRGGGWSWPVVVALACIGAPLLEETMFRGLFYRHLRELTRRWSQGWSVALSAAVCGLVFAIIHPQGLAVVPVLGALGAVFCVIREWRGSLAASMAAHAMHNGVAVVMLWLIAG